MSVQISLFAKLMDRYSYSIVPTLREVRDSHEKVIEIHQLAGVVDSQSFSVEHECREV